MIQSLNTSRRRIAVLLFCIFYSELVIGAMHQLYSPVRVGVVNNRLSSLQGNSLKNVNEAYSFNENPSTELDITSPESTIQAEKDFSETRLPAGPTQPEMQAFQSVGNSNMVDLFSGDFSYNIPLLDVGGYPVNIGYRSGITMDQEASWVGLGWNINPGTISRNLRGLPDDFNGLADTVKKTTSVRPNKTTGVTAGFSREIAGMPMGVGASLGIFHNSYKGWGMETGFNASLNAGAKGNGPLTAGLSITNNSQEGLTISPSIAVKLNKLESADQDGTTTSVSMSLPYNTRSGLKGLQMGVGMTQNNYSEANQKSYSYGSDYSSFVSFASPSYTPTISMPYTNNQFAFSAKIGSTKWVNFKNFTLTGYVSTQRIAAADVTQSLPAYGYMNFQNSPTDGRALLDYNREKEIPYREKPAVPHIAIPSYTYDLFSITGEGTGGMFRAYRGDIGFVSDHFMRTKDESERFSVDLGLGNLVHAGVDLSLNRSFTQSGPWLEQNALKNNIAFRKNNAAYESVYFRNPGEKAINSKAFYNAIGGDDVLAVNLYQGNASDPSILATSSFRRYRNKQFSGILPITNNVIKAERDKRTQVISYLNAEEASSLGLSKSIEVYSLNTFPVKKCYTPPFSNMATGTGLKIEYFNNYFLEPPVVYSPSPSSINIPATTSTPSGISNYKKLSVRWSGKMEAPVTGKYSFKIFHDNLCKVIINDSVVYNTWTGRWDGWQPQRFFSLNLVAGQRYTIKVELNNTGGPWGAKLEWKLPGTSSYSVIPASYLYVPQGESQTIVNGNVTLEQRVNSYRKKNHISEIGVLNADGRRYVYGIPVYNLKQKDATFSVHASNANTTTGMVKFIDGQNSVSNNAGKEAYFNSEELPAYTHSFLLTSILSSDYSDLTGDGISDDDLGDAIKFNYSRVAGISNAYKWRAPFTDSATYNEGLRTYNNDDKGSYVYGEKELWYLNSIESKNMLAVFEVENRLDGLEITETGSKSNGSKVKRLKEIRLYSKADYLKNPSTAKAIKTVHFEYSYELCKGVNKPVTDSGKLTLKKIWFSYNGNSKGSLNPYIFKYHSNNPTFNSKSFDRWGNYKNPSHNPGTISNAEYPYSLQGYTAQDSINADNNVAVWTMNEIKLPSGGIIKVDYESDDYAFVQNKRAMQMFKVDGFNSTSTYSSRTKDLYKLGGDNLFIFIKVPFTPSSKADAYFKYLEGIKKIYFKVAVTMPADKYGSGFEYVPCYADLDIKSNTDHSYYDRVTGSNVIWLRIKGIRADGTEGGPYSPIAKAATQFLKLNLPSKAYPGSEVGDNLTLIDGVKMVFSQVDNILNAFTSFDNVARTRGWAKTVDTARSFARLNAPTFKKRGGGLRVKRVTVYDNWKSMTGGTLGQAEATYGQEYRYTTIREVNGVKTTISSGVASYEPSLGNEENPFRLPIEYIEKVAPLGPTTLGYTEEPLGEALFPSASVGYSKIRVRSIHTKNKKSANGFEETQFYTAYDFPTIVDRSMIDDYTKKRFKPSLSNFLRINAKHYLTVSQGFKVELNDMHGKLRSQATYPETSPDVYTTYTENFYRIENSEVESKRLSNTVTVIKPDLTIDTTALIGKDVELMVDMREQRSIVNGANFNVNGDLFATPSPPFSFLIPALFGLPQREETQFRSAATTKVIQRFGILDSIIHVDKGSKVSTRNLLYDSETGDVLLTSTQNEFNEPIYNFSYPAHWAYEGMGLAYKNIGIVFDHINMKNGKIVGGLSVADSTYFVSGDEVMISSKPKTGDSTACIEHFASFPVPQVRLWVIDKNVITGGSKSLYFIDKDGKAFSGNDISLRIIRSGRRNMSGTVGSITMLKNPLVLVSGSYQLQLDTSKRIVNTSASEFSQLWKVTDRKATKTNTSCVVDTTASACYYKVLYEIFKNLKDSGFFPIPADSIFISDLIMSDSIPLYCPPFSNPTGLVYALTTDTLTTEYRIQMGNCQLILSSLNNEVFNINNLDIDKEFDSIYYTSESNEIYIGYASDTVPRAILRAGNCVYCDTIISPICFSSVTDTVVNPYVYGILGNYRAKKSYTYFTNRKETDPTSTTDIKRDGTFPDFNTFWTLGSQRLTPNYNSQKWVWTSEMTLFNKKGFELENKDPLGRYNSGLYGYGNSLPIAVAQNSQYREVAFDGFEDYMYGTNTCDTLCPVGRHFDFSIYKDLIDSTQKHTGKYSLRVNSGDTLSIGASVSASSFTQPPLTFTTDSNACIGTHLKSIRTNQNAVLPIFNPIHSKRVVLSAWVKESKDCKCESYTGNKILVHLTRTGGDTTYQLSPEGAIIEGWQRYEAVLNLNTNTQAISFSFISTDTSTVYIDDLRIHPFNANMKSFVYHPINLRLMAELDENNYATFYEYDDDGTLIRVKKETARGIKTLKETRSGLLKDN